MANLRIHANHVDEIRHEQRIGYSALYKCNINLVVQYRNNTPIHVVIQFLEDSKLGNDRPIYKAGTTLMQNHIHGETVEEIWNGLKPQGSLTSALYF